MFSLWAAVGMKDNSQTKNNPKHNRLIFETATQTQNSTRIFALRAHHISWLPPLSLEPCSNAHKLAGGAQKPNQIPPVRSAHFAAVDALCFTSNEVSVESATPPAHALADEPPPAQWNLESRAFQQNYHDSAQARDRQLRARPPPWQWTAACGLPPRNLRGSIVLYININIYIYTYVYIYNVYIYILNVYYFYVISRLGAAGKITVSSREAKVFLLMVWGSIL